MSEKCSYIDDCRERLVATTFNFGPESASDIADFYGESMTNESGEEIRLWLRDELSQSAINIAATVDEGDTKAAEDALGLALLHLKLAADLRGFSPNALFADALTTALNTMGDSGLYEMRNKTVTELGDLILTTAQTVKSDPNAHANPKLNVSIDEALCDVADAHRETNPELYDKSRNLITTPEVIEVLEWLDHDAFLADVLKHNALILFEHELTKTGKDFVIDLPWDVIYDKALPCTMDSSIWLNKILDIILKAKPNYFARQEDIDFYYGRVVGTVIGISRRLDLVDAMHATAEYRNSKTPLKTTLGIAYGLGISEGEDEFRYFMHPIRERFGHEYAKAVEDEYQRGLLDSQNS